MAPVPTGGNNSNKFNQGYGTQRYTHTEPTSNDYILFLAEICLLTYLQSLKQAIPSAEEIFLDLKNPPACETYEILRDPPHFVTLPFMSTPRKFSLHKSGPVI